MGNPERRQCSVFCLKYEQMEQIISKWDNILYRIVQRAYSF